MKPARIVRLAPGKGFTLVETLIVMVVLGIAAVAIISLQGNIFKGQTDNQAIQVGVQLMQECAEQILATRRASGFAASTSCSAMTLPGYTAPIVTTTVGSSTTITACPSATSNSCKLVSISQGGLTPVTLLLVNY